MTRAYTTLIGDGREIVEVLYEIHGDSDDFEIEIMHIGFHGDDIMGCLLTQQIVDIEMEIIKHHNHLMSGMGDV